jgi:fatty acid desaturase
MSVKQGRTGPFVGSSDWTIIDGMDEAFAPAGAIDRAALEALSRRSDTRGVVQFAGHCGALAATATLVTLTTEGPWLGPALIVHGIVVSFLFAPLHETIHRTAFRGRRLNDAVAWICGAVLVLPPRYFRAFHFAHHRHTQDPARDPELARPKPPSWRQYLWHVSGLPYWYERITTLFHHASGRVSEDFIQPRARAAVVREARALLAVYAAVALASIASGTWVAVVYWVVPAVLGQPALRLYLLAEHTGCPMVPDMLKNARTTQTTWPLRRLAWNMPYHAEHHAYPALPFHALPAAHRALAPRIAVQAPGYVAVHRDIIATLRRPHRDSAP